MRRDLAAEDRFQLLPEILDFINKCGIPEAVCKNGCGKLRNLAALLNEKNRQSNLTRITESREFWRKHVADSVSVALVCPQLFSETLKVVDIGSGAGFPLFPLACFFPNLQLTAIERTGKKADFILEAAAALRLTNISVFHAQAREAARDLELGHSFDFATARAVGGTAGLIRDAFRFLKKKPESRFALYKTPDSVQKERSEIDRECRKRKLLWQTSQIIELPGGDGQRQFVIIAPRGPID